ALWVSLMFAKRTGKRPLLMQACAALIMGAAICGMHYTGMAAAIFTPHQSPHPEMSEDFYTVALIIGIITTALLWVGLMVAVNTRRKIATPSQDLYNFPTKLLTTSMLLTIVVVMWMGGNSFYIHYFLTHEMARDQQIAEMSDGIMYMDSVLSQLAR